MTVLGYYDDTETGLAPYADDQLFQSVQAFQKDNDLKRDGVMKPGGPTQNKINEKLKESSEEMGAFMDFSKNYLKMRSANTIDADKYFHCVANYEASQRGWSGNKTAEKLSAKRLEYKKKFKNDSSYDLFQDETANIYGREAAKSGKFSSASEACSIFRPEGLDEKY